MKKKKIKHFLLYRLYAFFPKKYYNLLNSFFRYKLHYHLDYLQNKGLPIEVIYDIGAYEGEWTFFMEKTCLNKKLFYLFEANKKHEQMIKERGFKYHIGVLSNEIKDIKFYSKNHQGDSYYLEKTNFYEQDLKPKNIKSDTLDLVVKKNKFEFPDFIKIDTQGSELDILKGASNTLSTCKLIYLECPVIDYNKNAPTFDNYIHSLNSLGYVPIDVCDISYVDKVLIQIDILFIKKNLIYKYYKTDKILNILN